MKSALVGFGGCPVCRVVDGERGRGVEKNSRPAL